MRKYLSKIGLLAGFLILGAYFRLEHIGLRPFWLDEANSVNFLRYPVGSLWQKVAGAESAPAFIFALKFWSQLFGDTEFAIRLFSAFVGLLSVVAIYFLGKKIFNPKIGLWAAFLLSINYFSIFYSIQARQYSAVILISTLSAILFWRIISGGGLRDKIFFVFFSALGVYLHPWFFLLFAAEGIWIAVWKREKIKSLFFPFFSVLIFSVPWIRVLFQYGNSGVNDWIETPGPSALFETFHFFVFGSGFAYLAILALLGLAAFFQIEKIQNGDKITYKITENKFSFGSGKKGLSLIFALLVFPLLMAWIGSQFMPLYVVGRYEAVILPFFILAVACFFSIFENKYLIGAVGLVLVIFSCNSVRNDRNTILGYRYNEKIIAQQLAGRVSEGDALIFGGLSRPPFDYYLPRMGNNYGKYEEISFPAEMEDHPAFQNIKNFEKDKPQIEKEAANLSERLKNSGTKKIWLIEPLENPAFQILAEKIGKDFSCHDFLNLTLPENQPVSPLHFQKIAECEAK